MTGAAGTAGARAGLVAADSELESASLTDWIAVIGAALGALMAVLDITITNSALPVIQGEIGATGTEGTWIGTGYLAAEVVMIPLTAWFTRMLGLRQFLVISAIAFVFFSIVCGLANSLPQMIIGRAGQGLFGGALMPTAQVIMRTRLPPHQMAQGMSIFGVVMLIGPVLGPIMGGFLTDSASWHWCFFINLPIGAALVALLLIGLPAEKPNMTQLANADWLGIFGMTIGFSCITVVFEEGQRERWFESAMIVYLAIAAFFGFIAFAAGQMTSRNPVIKLGLLRNRDYSGTILVTFVLGICFYGVTFVLPQFLSGIAGYTSQQSGMVMALAAVPTVLLMPILPRIIGVFDVRLMLGLGLVLMSVSCFVDFHLSPDTSGDSFTLSQLLRGCGQMLAMMPLNQVSMAAIGRENAADGAGIYNMVRNLGGSVGLALLGMFIDLRTAIHSDSIRESVTANSLMGQERLNADGLGQGIDAATAQVRALAQLSGQIERQALILSYGDCFWIMGVAVLIVIPIVFVLRRPPPGSGMFGPSPVRRPRKIAAVMQARERGAAPQG